MLQQYFSQLMSGPNKYAVFIILGIMIVYIPFMFMFYKKRKNKAKKFIENNPFAAKIFLPSSGMTVVSVNAESPVFFQEGIKYGVLASPGENELEVEYSWTKYGISKNVTTTTGTSRQIITAEHGKSYKLYYDTENNKYVFEETK